MWCHTGFCNGFGNLLNCDLSLLKKLYLEAKVCNCFWRHLKLFLAVLSSYENTHQVNRSSVVTVLVWLLWLFNFLNCLSSRKMLYSVAFQEKKPNKHDVLFHASILIGKLHHFQGIYIKDGKNGGKADSQSLISFVLPFFCFVYVESVRRHRFFYFFKGLFTRKQILKFTFWNRKVLAVDMTKDRIQIALKILEKTTSAPAAKECLNKSIQTEIGSGPESFKVSTSDLCQCSKIGENKKHYLFLEILEVQNVKKIAMRN